MNVVKLAVLRAVAAATMVVSSGALGASYRVDSVHSMAIFGIGHLGISKIYGRFNDIAGTFTTDDGGELRAANIEIKTQSVDTAVVRRDNHLRSADFLNSAQFPLMTFVSTGVNALDGGRYELTGNLTLHGVTKPVTLVVAEIGRGNDSAGVEHVGAEGTFRIKRTDFGMGNMLGAAGDDIDVTIALEGIKQ